MGVTLLPRKLHPPTELWHVGHRSLNGACSWAPGKGFWSGSFLSSLPILHMGDSLGVVACLAVLILSSLLFSLHPSLRNYFLSPELAPLGSGGRERRLPRLENSDSIPQTHTLEHVKRACPNPPEGTSNHRWPGPSYTVWGLRTHISSTFPGEAAAASVRTARLGPIVLGVSQLQAGNVDSSRRRWCPLWL